ncbi:mucin TcMUCII [Trypanosoma cruzi Dm28c]|uniref:Mucin TcMUCII n=2 Tax=Trypanosoma cruzi TaxID=5693 RepID=V5AUT4_TRYCR|nr:mucin TcMUCII [Trypanosoma cruzi Dm28c]PBJ72474.1 mucin TcMUCII [Trypanosoma cruzi cruzi]PWV03347.1 putative mucin TcMUCII [Trypanosoma cruzi]
MTTCRLLCALLVLALCCCPSVCAAESEEDVNISVQPPVQPGVQTPSSTQLQSDISGVTRPKGNSDTTQVQNQASGGGGSENSLLTPPAPKGESVKSGTKGPTDPETGRTQETDAMAGAGVLQIKPGNEESPDSRSVTAPSTATTGISPTPPNELENNSAKRISAPTTTTTTTTTTAPEAPSTTTTEAPTTTTTRAPSLLREVDGSLSSSAWVCAPLLLAASALAYTTLG